MGFSAVYFVEEMHQLIELRGVRIHSLWVEVLPKRE